MLEELSAAVDALLEVDPQGLTDGELCDALVGVAAERARLEADEAHLTAAWDARKAWDADGARSGAAWLTWRCRLPRRDAWRRVRLARWVSQAPAVEAAWQAGDIGAAHAALLARAYTARTSEAFARDENVLVDAARDLSFAAFTKVLAYWSQHADPDGAEDTGANERERRRLHLSQTLDGMWLGDMVLDPVGGAAVAETLSLIEDELFAADWSDARARIGERATLDDLARTPGQRRADALVEMAARAAPSRSVIASATTPRARRWPTSRPTTSGPGLPAAPPPSTTAASLVATTTDAVTDHHLTAPNRPEPARGDERSGPGSDEGGRLGGWTT
ncbi:MAG: DUF222 domain-containing protein [Acidimicrobiia bacterium]|nr:DUF222 domain-containing protein [Acidimicrobiia bacterium]